MPRKTMKDDYSETVRLLYEKHADHALRIQQNHVVYAGIVVEKLFPPATPRDTLSLLAALNLLNAAVKLPWGRRIVTYGYIKGMASCLLTHLLNCPMEGVDVFLDLRDHVCYFAAMGVQVSFHHVPLYRELLVRIGAATERPQVWSGMQLQKIAVEFFLLTYPDRLECTSDDEERVCRLMMARRKPTPERVLGRLGKNSCVQPTAARAASDDNISTCDDWPTMTLTATQRQALDFFNSFGFSMWHRNAFTLYRRQDDRELPVVRYNGHNYPFLIERLIGQRAVYRRPESTLEVGKLYHVTPKMRLRTIAPSRYMLSMTQNNYLRTADGDINLCFTYGIARYLACLFPSLRFVCTLNFNRLVNQRRYYTPAMLYRVPLGSPMRTKKVWMAVDPRRLLTDFDPFSLPQQLLTEQMETDDYYDDYQIITAPNGLKGLYAYSHVRLLPAIFSDVRLHNFHAHVRNADGLWAIFSLLQECFLTPFIYKRIWFDSQQGAILGTVKGKVKLIYKFRLAKP